MSFATRAIELTDRICGFRHELHMHPEPALRETDTTEYLVRELRELGLRVECFEDYNGCIATVGGVLPGPTVMLRADIDALPIREETGLPFASREDGLMHACGHDCHMSMLLGAAVLLSEVSDRLPGTVRLLFQSGEEAFIGSHYYADRGHLEGVDALLGMHVWPTIPAGTVSIRTGHILASCDNFTLTITGKAAPAARPERGADAATAAAAVIRALQTVVTRGCGPDEHAVVTVATVRAEAPEDTLCARAVLEGSVRTVGTGTRERVEARIRHIAETTAAAMGCSAALRYEHLVPPLSNLDARTVDIARRGARALWGESVLCDAPLSMASEDFAYLAERVPQALFLILGMRDETHTSALHSCRFDVDERRVLPLGASLHAQFAWDYLMENGGGRA